ncbi:MAG: alpha-galactosidase [Candidatus Izemoplasma sp.]|nr:alpha-galactosidase [Candidatus Izemoplasma sp.]
MIKISDKVFHLSTETTSYLFCVNEHNHLEHLYYGEHLDVLDNIDAYLERYAFELGSATSYRADTRGYMLNHVKLEASTYGKGDYRLPMLHIEGKDGIRTTDFTYKSHHIITNYTVKNMPLSRKEETLKVILYDDILDLELALYYSVFTRENIITRHAEIRNCSSDDVVLDRASSINLDLLYNKQVLTKLDGAWIREKHKNTYQLTKGTLVIDSKKGVSSADHNPAFMLQDDVGITGMILMYSGNFEATFEVTPHDLLRVTLGINHFDFRYTLSKDSTFITPEVILSYSVKDETHLANQFHQFINAYVIPKQHQKARPIIINNWEATYFDFNEKKLIAIAKKAKKLGMELLCLDDGWFGHRDDDTSSLGDWQTHPKKLKKGLGKLITKINAIGLEFGLWIEPEMISINSELYIAHPEWAIQLPDTVPSIGRNQLVLDLAQQAVQDFIIETVSELLKTYNITYIKWDHNRNLTDSYTPGDNPYAHHYLYTMGLYRIIETLTTRHQDVLFESCASGGNRADLGMMYYMPQTWTSDNTDPDERLLIQEGASLFYPLSNMSNHVASEVSHQMFRKTPLETRFNVAAFGVLGYELDVTKLTPFDEKVIAKQILFYKTYRTLFQYGYFQIIPHPKYHVWAVYNDTFDQAIVMVYQHHMTPNPRIERIKIPLLTKGSYTVETREQFFNIRAFGSLVNEALPISLKVHSWLYNTIANRYLFKANTFNVTRQSTTLKHHGLILPHEFTSTGYNDQVMPLPDYNSQLFILKKIKEIDND